MRRMCRHTAILLMMLPVTLFSAGLWGRVPHAGPNESNLEGMPLFPEQQLPGRDGEREAGVLVSTPAAWRFGRCDLHKGLGLILGFHRCVELGALCPPLRQPGELKSLPVCPSRGNSVAIALSKQRLYTGFILPEKELLPVWREIS